VLFATFGFGFGSGGLGLIIVGPAEPGRLGLLLWGCGSMSESQAFGHFRYTVSRPRVGSLTVGGMSNPVMYRVAWRRLKAGRGGAGTGRTGVARRAAPRDERRRCALIISERSPFGTMNATRTRRDGTGRDGGATDSRTTQILPSDRRHSVHLCTLAGGKPPRGGFEGGRGGVEPPF